MKNQKIRLLQFLLAYLLFFSINVQSQDFGVSSVNAPSTGCDLGISTVNVSVINYGANQTLVTVDLKYRLDGGSVISQSQVFSNFSSNSTQNVTFTIPVNLSNSYGKHKLVAFTDFGADTKRSNDTTVLEFFNYQPTRAGVLAANDTVCMTNNGDTLRLSGKVGEVVQWESDNGNGFVPISNTDTFQVYSNLKSTTRFRTLVKNGTCSNQYSNTITIQVDTPAYAGTLSASAIKCLGEPGDTLRLTNYRGTIAFWQKNEGNGWMNIANQKDTLVYSSLTKTTDFRVVVNKGVCAADTSNTVNITVIPNSVGGNIIPAVSNVCAYNNGDTLRLINKTGDVKRWELSDDNGKTWIPFINTDTFHIYADLKSTRQFRAYVQFKSCSAAYSSVATVTTDPAPNAGVLLRDNQICAGMSAGDTLRLTEYDGTIVKWQLDSGKGWQDIVNTSDSLVYATPGNPTKYRVIVKKGSCPDDTSNIVTISVVSSTFGGNIIPKNIKVCENDNNGILELTNKQGNVTQWEISDDNGATWLAAVNRSTQQKYNNLSGTRWYRVLVEASGCPPKYSDTAVVEVIAKPKGGKVIRDKSICGGVNRDTLILVNYTGNVLFWQSNAGQGWQNIANTGDTLIVTSLLQTTSYRAVVGNGVCKADTSEKATLTIIATTYGGQLHKSDSICKGSNSGELVLKNHVGDIKWWEVSTDKGVNWTIRSNQDTIQKYLNVEAESWYRVLVEGKNCPNDYSDTAVLTPYFPPVKITPNGSTQFCKGGQVQLMATAGYTTYRWNTGDSTTAIIARNNGMYVVTIRDARNCAGTDSVKVTVWELPEANAGDDVTISLGATIQLNASGGESYLWRPGEWLSDSAIPNPYATPWLTTTYTVFVTDSNGCINSDDVVVTVLKDYNLNGKNLITPNGDGINDVWEVNNILPYADCMVTIINRYGDVVYRKKGYDNKWDGTDGNRKVSDGTYYYIITCDGSNQVIKGNITVLTK